MEELDQLLPWSNLIPVICKIPNKEYYIICSLYLEGVGLLTLTKILY